MTVFLIGFMGSGKSFWGHIWAKLHSLQFIDLDESIEQQEKRSIADIFELKGEDYFREKESVVLRTFVGIDNCIIACGGGTPCFNNNMKWMSEHGTTVYLRSTVQDILDRVIDEQDKRPLIKKLNMAELQFFIEKKLKEREPFYTTANIILNSKELNELTFSEKILKRSAKKIK